MQKTLIVSATYDSDFEPVYGSEHASGADLKAALKEAVILKAGERVIIPTSVFLAIPEGYEAQVRPRSGLAAKFGITVLNTPGTIDADYRGEIKVILFNSSKEDFFIQPGDRIAQMVFAPVVQAQFIKKENLNETERGHGGFGSTGV